SLISNFKSCPCNQGYLSMQWSCLKPFGIIKRCAIGAHGIIKEMELCKGSFTHITVSWRLQLAFLFYATDHFYLRRSFENRRFPGSPNPCNSPGRSILFYSCFLFGFSGLPLALSIFVSGGSRKSASSF